MVRRASITGYDYSKALTTGVRRSSREEPNQIIAFQRGARVRGDDDDSDQDAPFGTDPTPGRKSKKQNEDGSSDSEEEDETDMYQVQPINFPQSKSAGSVLIMERMAYMAKMINRMRNTHGERAPSKKSWSRRRQVPFPEPTFDVDTKVQERVIKNYMEDMEMSLAQCSQMSHADFKVLDMVGPEGQEMLFQGQKKVLDYFRHKYTMIDRDTDISKIQAASMDDVDEIDLLQIIFLKLARLTGIMTEKKCTDCGGVATDERGGEGCRFRYDGNRKQSG